MLRIFHNTKFDFIKWWRWAAGLTIAFIVLGLASFAFRGGVNYSIEFTGGTLIQLQFQQPPDAAELRRVIDAAVPGSEIQQFGASTEYTVRAQEQAETVAQGSSSPNSARNRIDAALRERYANGYTIVRAETVGAKVGSELRRDAAIAMLLASLVTLIYLAIRFEWRFGVAAVLSTAHDVFVTLAFIKLLHVEVSLTVIAGILTLLGYSGNDTIIIFDRVRENLKKARREPLYDTLNRSINETLPRSIMTHSTTLAATLALLFFAGEVIRPFAIVMAFGIFVATFSSIYVASPLLLYIEHRWPRQEHHGSAAGGKGSEAAGTRPAKPSKAERTAAARTSAQPTR